MSLIFPDDDPGVPGLIRIDLPYPPTINHYYIRSGDRVVLGPRGRDYRKAVCILLAFAKARPIDGDVCLSAVIHPPDKRRRDIDNIMKALLDALQHGGAYHDDSQIVCQLSVKSAPVPGGKVRVQVWPTKGGRA